MKIVGPALGGVMIALFGPSGNFFVQAIAYIGVLFMIYWMHVPPTSAQTRQVSALANLKEGFSYVWSTPAVLALMILAYVPRVFAVPYQTLMPVFQKDVLKVGPEGLGLLMAATGRGRGNRRAVARLARQSDEAAGTSSGPRYRYPGLLFNTIFPDHQFSTGVDVTGSRGHLQMLFSPAPTRSCK